ncbi:hypothetical protein SAMN04488128_1011166 [Chitinophaga eiseniae]|uniref:Uncharacterized protein n=1 Tax=Chitinophaga eiseniae TaxID=634771 RepID=A0A1T4MLT4_9BACT|nr:hypothetical protein [Chitinophaga eiseniae]SJZ67952.1 hypothetical protein SAMN04488128_1011166 [Chitinophaga eiseniae]
MQRKFSLEWFEVFISKTLLSANLNTAAITASFIRESLRKAAAEKDRIRMDLLREMFSATNEEQMRVSVKRYQLLLIHLLDELHHQDVANGYNRLLRKLYSCIREYLKELLMLIENHFSRYFDLEQKVPESYLSLCREELSKGITSLEERLYKAKQDDRLVQILINHLWAFVNSHRVQMTYRDFMYVKDAWNELQHSRLYEKHGRSLPLLVELLIRINYNTPVFVCYFIHDYMAAQLSTVTTTDEKIAIVHRLKSKVRKVNRLPNLRMLSDLPDIGDQIMDMLSEELSFLQPVAATVVHDSSGNEYKVQTNLPVPMLAAIFRLFKESGVILNSNIKKLLEFISAHYSSMKQEKISYTHLHSSYYDIDQRNKERLYDMLMQLAKECRKL